jgi:hypothetical protein
VRSTICFSLKCFFIAANASSSSRAVIFVTASAHRTAKGEALIKFNADAPQRVLLQPKVITLVTDGRK